MSALRKTVACLLLLCGCAPQSAVMTPQSQLTSGGNYWIVTFPAGIFPKEYAGSHVMVDGQVNIDGTPRNRSWASSINCTLSANPFDAMEVRTLTCGIPSYGIGTIPAQPIAVYAGTGNSLQLISSTSYGSGFPNSVTIQYVP